MRVAFTADESGFNADEYAIVCGVAGDGHYLTFQRDAEGATEDWGIHLEYDGQANGGYSCVAECRLGPECLSIDLSHQLGELVDVTGFDVVLRLDKEQQEVVREGLLRIFRGQSNMLVVAAPIDPIEQPGVTHQ